MKNPTGKSMADATRMRIHRCRPLQLVGQGGSQNAENDQGPEDEKKAHHRRPGHAGVAQLLGRVAPQPAGQEQRESTTDNP